MSETSKTAPVWSALNARMVDRLKESGAIRSRRVEDAFREIPRHLFLPGRDHDVVYSGQAIVTRSDAEGRPTSSSSEPAIMAPMIEALSVEPGQRVLEIGVGTGFNAALLDRLVGSDGAVVSVDVQPDVAEEAQANLAAAGHARVRVVAGDGYVGYEPFAPYDRIIATAGVRDVSRSWRDQLREGGMLVVPMRFRSGSGMVVAFRRAGDELESVAVITGGFMPLRTEHQALEAPVKFGEDWEAWLEPAEEGDGDLLGQLLRAEPTIESFREVPWQVTFCLIGLVEPNWMLIRQKQRPTPWSGLLDRASRGIALLVPIPLPVAAPRSAVLTYGSAVAGDRLRADVDALAEAKVERLRIRAVPSDGKRPTGDVVFEKGNFTYAINWRQAKTSDN